MNNPELYLAHLIGFQGGEKGPPVIKRIIGTDPNAAAECVDSVPVGKLWRLLSYTVNLVATVQTPLPNLVIDDGSAEVISFPGASAALTAGVTSQFTWAPGVTLSGGAAAVRNYSPIPAGLLLLGNTVASGLAQWRIKTVTTGIGANCNYGAPTIFVAEYSV
jgi:hypothetical protein